MPPTPNYTVPALEKGLDILEILAAAAVPQSLADLGVSGYGLNVVTSRATLAANDTQVRAVANAIFEGYKDGCANQSAAVAEFAKEFPDKNATYVRDSWARACAIVGPAPGKQDAAGWQNTIDMYRSLGLLQEAVRPEEILP